MQDDRSETPEPGHAGPPIEAPPPSEPVFNIPMVLMVLIVGMLAIYGVQSRLMSEITQDRFVSTWAFRPELYTNGHDGAFTTWLFGPVSYSLLHGSFAHVGFNSLWLAVFGTPVARRLSLVSFIAFWVISAIAAAFFFAVTTSFEPSYLIGASGVVSATSGAACRFAISPRGFTPALLQHQTPLLSIFGALQRRSVLTFVGFWLISNVLVGFGFSPGTGDAAVAWQAHIGGFLFGYLFFGFFDRRRT